MFCIFHFLPEQRRTSLYWRCYQGFCKGRKEGYNSWNRKQEWLRGGGFYKTCWPITIGWWRKWICR